MIKCFPCFSYIFVCNVCVCAHKVIYYTATHLFAVLVASMAMGNSDWVSWILWHASTLQFFSVDELLSLWLNAQAFSHICAYDFCWLSRYMWGWIKYCWFCRRNLSFPLKICETLAAKHTETHTHSIFHGFVVLFLLALLFSTYESLLSGFILVESSVQKCAFTLCKSKWWKCLLKITICHFTWHILKHHQHWITTQFTMMTMG